jgi:predicted TIM-barrel fold metal-dependent hydrolase
MNEERVFKGNIHRSSADLDAWLSHRREVAIDPDLPVIDAHHHLWAEGERRYELQDLIADIGTVNVVGSVFVECGSAYADAVDYTMGDLRAGLYERPVAETRYVVAAARGCAQAARYGLCNAIVGFANLVAGEKIARAVLEAHIEAGDGRFRGIRQSAAWDPVIGPLAWRAPPPGLLLDERFQSGFSALAALGLSFDAWIYYPQMHDLIALARRFPGVTIVLDHFGGIVGVGHYATRPEECFAVWRRYIRELSECHNVVMKMGGLGMPATGSKFHLADLPPDSEQLAASWKPFVDVTVEAFGANRCMIGSNFPVDRQTAGYATLWNAYNFATKDYSAVDRQALFCGTARRVYKMNDGISGLDDFATARRVRR